jgi:hypothetical protein
VNAHSLLLPCAPDDAQLVEDYERQRQAEEEARRQKYEEEARMRLVRPHQIITGQATYQASKAAYFQRGRY